MPQGSSGEWHTGEVVSLCESYGFIRKKGARPDIFMHYDDVEGFEPQIGDRVSFELAADARFPDRQKAVAVEYSGRPRPETSPQIDEATAAGDGAAADAPATPTLVMGDDGTMYTLPQPEVPPPETIYAGTVSSFGANNTTYGFIRLDHTGNEVFVSRDDAPDGYLSPGDRCEFRIVDAGVGVTGAQQWQAVDVVCIQCVNGEQPPACEEAAAERPSGVIKTLEKGKKCTRGTIEAADAGPKIHFYLTGLAAKTLSVGQCVTYTPIRNSKQVVARWVKPDTTSAAAKAKACERALDARKKALVEREAAVAKREAEIPKNRRERRALAERRARDARESAQAVVTPPAARALPYGASLLRRLDLQHLAPILAREQIDAATLPFLTLSDFVETGISPADARRLVDAVAADAEAARLASVEQPGRGPDWRQIDAAARGGGARDAEAKTPAAPDEPAASSPSEHRAELWCCPISMEIMRDPVLAADGFTYERQAISDWLSRGKTTSPTTNEPLAHLNLTPNHLVKSTVWKSLGDDVASMAWGVRNLISTQVKQLIAEFLGDADEANV